MNEGRGEIHVPAVDDPILVDTAADPCQETNLAGDGDHTADRLRELLVAALGEMAAPKNQYDRLGLAQP